MPKQIAFRGCSIETAVAPSWPKPVENNVGHVCDTEGGSSGSPLLGSDYKVVGLHHLGFIGNDKWGRENRGVRIGLIMDLLKIP